MRTYGLTLLRSIQKEATDGRAHDPMPENGQAGHNGHPHGAREIRLYAGLLLHLVLPPCAAFRIAGLLETHGSAIPCPRTVNVVVIASLS